VASVPGVTERFKLSTTLAVSPITFYALGQVIGPAITTSASELFGRRIVLQISACTALLFTIGAGWTQNFPTLVVLRFLASVAVSPCPTVSLGMINDLWDISVSKIGAFMLLIAALASVIPAALGLVVGAPIVQARDWRWTFWVTAILLGFSLLAILPIPETYRPEIMRTQAKKQKKPFPARGDIKLLLFITVARPFQMLVQEPIIFPTGLVSTVAQATIFCYYAAYPVMLVRVYSFDITGVGLAFLPIFIGNLLAVPVLAVIDKVTYQKARSEAQRSGATILPELRLHGAIIGGITLPISLFWLAWTARKSIHWIVPLLSGALFGLSYTLILVRFIPTLHSTIFVT
jgi:MFS family permease